MPADSGRTTPAGRRAWTFGALAAVMVGIGVAVSLIGGGNSPAAGDSPTPPPAADAQGRTWEAVLHTSVGEIGLSLDGAAAPQAVASFIHLAEEGFFDGTECHRLLPDSLLQCGDPGPPVPVPLGSPHCRSESGSRRWPSRVSFISPKKGSSTAPNATGCSRIHSCNAGIPAEQERVGRATSSGRLRTLPPTTSTPQGRSRWRGSEEMGSPWDHSSFSFLTTSCFPLIRQGAIRSWERPPPD